MLRISILFVALFNVYAQGATKSVCPNKVVAFSDFTREINLELEPHERVSSGLRFLGKGDLISAGVIGWEKDMHPRGTEERSGRFLIVRSEDAEEVASGNYGRFVPERFIAFADRPTWLGINWQPGPFTVFSFEEEGGVEERHEIAATLTHRGGPGMRMVANSVDVSPNGKTMLAVYSTDAVIFNALTGQKQFRIQMDPNFRGPSFGFSLSTMDATYSYDGAYVLSAHSWGVGGVWDGNTGKMRAAFETPQAHGHFIPGITASDYGNHFMVHTTNPGDEKTVRHTTVYRIDPEGRKLHPEAPGEPKVEVLRAFHWEKEHAADGSDKADYRPPFAFAPYDNLLVGNEKGDIEVFDLSADPNLQRPHLLLTQGHGGSPVTNVTASPNGDFFASASRNGVVCLWGYQAGQTHYRIEGNGDPISVMQFSKNGRWLLINTQDPHDTARGYSRAQANNSYLVDLEALSRD